MSNQNPALKGLQGVTLNMSDPRNKMPRRFTPNQPQESIPTQGGGSAGLTGSANDALGGYLGGLDLKDELSENLANTPSTDRYAVERLKGLLGNNQKDLDSSYIPEQAEETNLWHQNDQAARTEGFGSMGTTPTSSGQSAAQSREIYRRSQNEEKMRQPVELQRMEQAGALERQRVQSQGIVDQARVGAEGRQEGYDLLRQAMTGGLKPGQRVSVSGAGSTNAPAGNSISSAHFKEINDARKELEFAQRNVDSSWNPWAGQGDVPQRQASLDQAIQGFLVNYEADPALKDLAHDIYKNKTFNGKDLSSILLEIGENEITEDEFGQLDEILRTIRGGQ